MPSQQPKTHSSTEKRVVFALTNNPYRDRRVLRLAITLSQNGYQVRLIGLEWPNQLKDFNSLEDTYNLTVQLLKTNQFQGKLAYWNWFWLFLKAIFFAPEKYVVAIDLDTLPAVVIAAKLRGKKVLFDAHEIFSELPEVVNRPITQFIWQQLERWAIPLTEGMITVSQPYAGWYSPLKLPSAIIENRPDFLFSKIDQTSPQTVDSPFSNNNPYWVYLGAVNHKRGLEPLLAAAEKLPALNLLIIGEGDLLSTLKHQYQHLIQEGRVLFTGFLSDQQWPELVRNAQIGYLILEDAGFSYCYSLANKVYDYLNLGIPILVPPFPAYSKLILSTQAGIILNATQGEIIQTYHQLQSNTQLVKQLKENAEKCKGQYLWPTQAQLWLDTFNEFMS